MAAAALAAPPARLSALTAASAVSCSSSSCRPSPRAAVTRASALRSAGFLSTPLSISGYPVRRPGCAARQSGVAIRAMAEKKEAPPARKKEDSAVKRARIAEHRRIYNKSRKSEMKTRMKKVFLALDGLKKQGGGEGPEAIKPVEALISQAYKIIDKSVKVGTLHRNTGGNRKSRLARAKRTVEIQLGWYTPTTPAS